MEAKWSIGKISTPERIFAKIAQEMPQPVGIVIFGADCDLKDDAYRRCVEQIPNLATGYGGKGNMALRAAKWPLSQGRSVVTVMTENASSHHAERQQVITALQDMGAKSVVGVYAKPSKRPIRPLMSSLQDVEFNKTVSAIEGSNPTADDLSYFVVVKDDENKNTAPEETATERATTRIIWSGLTGKTGRAAIAQAQGMTDVKIVAGLKRNVSGSDDFHLRGEAFEGVDWLDYKTGMCGLYGLTRLIEQAEANVIIDFSHSDVLDRVLELAVRTGKPLICGTSGLSARQMASLYDATNHIPVFRGGNFRFKVKHFLDKAVALAQKEGGRFDLYENFWKGKELPSETAKALRHKIGEVTGKTVEIHSSDTFDPGNWINDWEFQVHRQDSSTEVLQDKIHCRVFGFDELAHDVLEIAKVMANMPVRKGEFYTLDDIWDEIPESAKM